jgi:hypothetical protein
MPSQLFDQLVVGAFVDEAAAAVRAAAGELGAGAQLLQPTVDRRQQLFQVHYHSPRRDRPPQRAATVLAMSRSAG